jgi:uncharacterized protein (DUF1697 family)
MKVQEPARYVALLRAINVGGNNRVEMKKLKEVFESLGCTNVSTYINSGNVIFSSTNDEASLRNTIEQALEKSFSFTIPTLIRTKKNIQKVCAAIPDDIHNDDTMKADVLFLWDEYANKKTCKLITIKEEVDTLVYVDGAIIWTVSRENYTRSGMNKFIGTEVYKNMTARNVNTVRKLNQLLQNLRT